MKLDSLLQFAAGAIPAALLLAVLVLELSVDIAVGIIQAILSAAAVPLIVGNHRMKIGQPKTGMIALGTGLICIGIMFVTVGLLVTAAMVLLSGILWSAVAVQAFKYGGAK